MTDGWLLSPVPRLVSVAVSTLLIYGSVILYTRVTGLRSFAKLSAFEFASTLAIGSTLASVAVSESVSVATGMVALGVLYIVDYLIGIARRVFGIGAFDNEPLLLAVDGVIVDEAMRQANMTEDDLRAKLREANVLSIAEAKAIVMETTGDVSVLHGDDAIDADLLKDVRDLRTDDPQTVDCSFENYRRTVSKR